MKEYKELFSIERMAKILKVSRSGYYSYLQTKENGKSDKEVKLVTEILTIFAESKQTYGSPRIHAELKARGYRINKKKVARLMKEKSIRAKTKGGFKIKAKAEVSYVADNLLLQDFSCNKPNEKWASDISYIATASGWLYLAVILDLFSKKVVGMAISSRIDANLVISALYYALGRRNITTKILLHSDQGSQYTSIDFQNNLALYGITCSMSSKGNCYDNAVVESFFGTLKTELDWNRKFDNIDQAKANIFEYIECWYNNKRRHSSLGYLSPREFEEQYYKNCSYVTVYYFGGRSDFTNTHRHMVGS